MKYAVTINDRCYEIEVENGEAAVLSTSKVVPVEVKTIVLPKNEEPVGSSKVGDGLSSSSVNTIHAPMPGVIMNVKVTVGTQVKRGEVLMILEAMKMENEIFAPQDGILTQIAVAKGATVNTGDVLATVQ